MRPPYSITPKILALSNSISAKIGTIDAVHLQKPPIELRKKNRIKSIHASLAIEGNTLTVEQITAILENKRVFGPRKDILEVQNAIAVYDQLAHFKPNSLASFCKAHQLLMKGLVESPGKLRTRGIGILKGKEIAHLAPPAGQVKPLMNALFEWVKKDKDFPVIKSCVFHYEVEFIHPFLDGNGRMGRLWQTVLLKDAHPVFESLPVETIIKRKQKQYYAALSASDKAGNSTAFVEYMLDVLNEALETALKERPNVSLTAADRIGMIPDAFPKGHFSRKDYLRHFRDISTATASRDLQLAVESGKLKKSGDKRTTVYVVAPRKTIKLR